MFWSEPEILAGLSLAVGPKIPIVHYISIAIATVEPF